MPYNLFGSLCESVQVMETTDPEKVGPRTATVGSKKCLQLLRDCSGAFQPGIFTAIVGASGTGKTTLIDVLAGRKTSESPNSPPLLPQMHSRFSKLPLIHKQHLRSDDHW